MTEEINIELLNTLGERWLQRKIQRMRNLLKIAEPDEALYREIMLSLGYPSNKVHFLELSLIIPFKEIKELKERERIEKALLYRAGFIDSKEGLPETFDFSLRIDKSLWNFKGIRPVNYPDKRIRGITYLLSQTIHNGLVNYFIERLRKQMTHIQNPKDAKECVNKIIDFQGVGEQRKKEMFFNIILPFMIAFCENEDFEIIEFLKTIFSIHPPLSENSITKSFRKSLSEDKDYLQLNSSTKTYFGIHFLMKEDLR